MYDKLVKRLRNAAQWADKGLVITPSICLEAANAIEELGELKWISVTERLPEKALPEALPQFPYSNWMLIYHSGGKTIDFARYCVDEKEWHDDFGEVATGVTHWMPLPKSPEGCE